MTATTTDQLTALRTQFDQRFAEPETAATAPGERLLGVRVGRAAAPFLLALADVARLAPMPRVVRVPAAATSVLGIATQRGRIVVVHHLASVLGLDGGEPRWILRLAGGDIALAVEQHDGVLHADAVDWLTLGADSVPLCSRALRRGDGLRPLIDSAALRHHLSSAATPPAPPLRSAP